MKLKTETSSISDLMYENRVQGLKDSRGQVNFFKKTLTLKPFCEIHERLE
jgi:hypothetical protein